MKVTFTAKVKMFDIPARVYLENEGLDGMDSRPVGDISAEVLAQMADEWRQGLFLKAGKSDPAKNKTRQGG